MKTEIFIGFLFEDRLCLRYLPATVFIFLFHSFVKPRIFRIFEKTKYTLYAMMSLLGTIGLVGSGLFAAKEVKDRIDRAVTPDVPEPVTTSPEMAYGAEGARDMYGSINDVVAAHADCSAEVLSLAVHGRRRASLMKRLRPGDWLKLRPSDIDGFVDVIVYRTCVGQLMCPDGSRVPELLGAGKRVWAYLGGRDLEYFYSDSDFCSIIVFYKVPGVPPTKVNLQF